MDEHDQPDRPDGERPEAVEPPTVPHTGVDRLLRRTEAVAEPWLDSIKGVADSTIGAATAAVSTIRSVEMPGARVRRVRRLAKKPLASLDERHPDVRLALPIDIGLRSIAVDAIEGTAVGGGHQRGGDFLPLKPFRGTNWMARWQRLRLAHARMAHLPPIDVVKYAGRYWVTDGHNRVALAKYGGQLDIDANVTELVRPGEQRTEAFGSLRDVVEASRPARDRLRGDGR